MPLPLKVVGTQILNSKGELVILRGVNCASMEWTSDGQGHILQSVKVAIDDWHVSHIRLPLAQGRWFGKAPEQKDEGKAYRVLVKKVVGLCASKDCYIIPDLHWAAFVKQMLAGTLPRYAPPTVPAGGAPPAPQVK